MITIRLNDIKLHAYHGVMEQENIVGNDFIINIELEVDVSKALYSDDICDTISYAEVYDVVKDEMMKTSKLIENVCYRIIKRIQETFPKVNRAIVRIDKLNPPMGADIASASVTIDSLNI